MDYSALEEAGISKAEMQVYTSLLELGSTTAGPIIRRTGFQSSTTYFCLEKLRSKGLLKFVIRNNKKYFQAAPPERILEFIREQKEKFTQKEHTALGLIKSLTIMQTKSSSDQEIVVYEGFSGIKSAFLDILSTMPSGSEYCVLGARSGEPVELVEKFLKRFHIRRGRKRIRIKLLANEDMKKVMERRFRRDKYSELRYMPSGYVTRLTPNIYGDKVLLAIWMDKPSAVVIKNSAVADSFREYFELIWESSK